MLHFLHDVNGFFPSFPSYIHDASTPADALFRENSLFYLNTAFFQMMKMTLVKFSIESSELRINKKLAFGDGFGLFILCCGFICQFLPPASSQEVIQDYSYWAQLCESLTQAQQYEQANTACNNAISFNPKDSVIWGLWGNVLLKMKNYPKAIITYGQQLRLDPTSSIAHLGQCESYYYLSQYEDAIASCESALKSNLNWQNASPQQAWYFRGEAFRQLNQPENALLSYDWAIKLDESYSPAYSSRCLVLFNQDNYQEALEACQTARQFNNWDGVEETQGWEYEGQIYQKLQQYPQALSAYEQALARNPQNGFIWRKKAETLQLIGNYSQAITANAWALLFMPQDRLTLTQQCALLNLINQSNPPAASENNSQNKDTNKENQGQNPEKNDYAQALASCDKALQVGTGNWNELGAAYAWNQRGNALIGLGRYEEALVSFNNALALQPNYGEAWNNRSVALWNLEQYAEALTSLEKALSLNPSDSQAWFNKGRILTQQQQYEQAIIAYNQALAGDVNYQLPTAKAPIWLNQSAVFWQLKQYQAAVETAQKVLEIKPDRNSVVKALYNKSLALIALYNYSEAGENLKSLLEIAPDNQPAKDAIKFIQQQVERQQAPLKPVGGKNVH